jgi:RimJ/RimL family protein N-acetyltransferase
MGLSRWWRERQFERSYRRSTRADLARIGKEYEAKFKMPATGNDIHAAMSAYLETCRLPDLRLETLRSRRLRRKADARGVELPKEWWEHDEEHDLWFLTPDGRRQAKQRLTQERMWAVKQWIQVLAPAVALVVGLAGVLIGLLSMWRWP